jgi:hypothetical protein
MPIYFLRGIHGGPIKIGYTSDVRERRQRLQRHYKCKLKVLAAIEGGVQDEKEIHARFAHLRIGKTEQFRPAAELMDYIGAPRVLPEDLKAVKRYDQAVVRIQRAVPYTRRKITTSTVRDEHHLMSISISEIDRVMKRPHVPDLAFILPSCTIVASEQDALWLCQHARRELGRWNMWLNSWLRSEGNKRRAFRDRKPEEYAMLVAGVFIHHGKSQRFTDFEREIKRR